MLTVHKSGILINFIYITYSAHILHLKIARKWHSPSDFVINYVLLYDEKTRKLIIIAELLEQIPAKGSLPEITD